MRPFGSPARSWRTGGLGSIAAGVPFGLPAGREDQARAMCVAIGHEDDHLALVTDAEGIDGLGEIAPKHGPDAPALEEAAHHQRLALVATAAHLGEDRLG